MKKIIMMLAAAVCAIGANAANSNYTVAFQSTLEYHPGKPATTSTFTAGVLGYYSCYSMSKETVAGLIGATVKSGQDGVEQVSAWLNANFVGNGSAWMRSGTKLDNKIVSVESGSKKALQNYTAPVSYANAKAAVTANEFAVLFYHDDEGEGHNSFRVFRINLDGSYTAASIVVTGGSMSGKTNWATNVADGPGPVPEPTSAMLMLLGVAGLALRRKQK